MPQANDGDLLKVGSALNVGGLNITVASFLGAGGQGEVYRVRANNNREYALKWLFPHECNQNKFNNFNTLVEKGAPDRRFLWPLAVATQQGNPLFGYIMDLRESRFSEVTDFMTGKADPRRRVLAKAMVQVADSLMNLHTKGLVYADLNFANFFVDSQRGDLMICDNDNVHIERPGKPENGDVLGKPEFQAPEVARNEVRPNKYTDQHSLAVLLFYMFVVAHPYEGDFINQIPGFLPDKDKLIYGKPAPFIFHPKDKTNPPTDPAIVKRWSILPNFIRKRFMEAFVDKVNSPYSRVPETVWRAELLKLHDSIVACPGCKIENYYDRESLKPGVNSMGICHKCKAAMPLPPRLRLKRGNEERIVILSTETALYAPHIGEDDICDLSKPLGTIEAHPKFPNVLGLKNETQRAWLCTLPDGNKIDVAPGKRIKLNNGTKIQFGRVQGEFRC
jgi:eukaryotic-like serine/threonine-protein kinase